MGTASARITSSIEAGLSHFVFPFIVPLLNLACRTLQISRPRTPATIAQFADRREKHARHLAGTCKSDSHASITGSRTAPSTRSVFRSFRFPSLLSPTGYIWTNTVRAVPARDLPGRIAVDISHASDKLFHWCRSLQPALEVIYPPRPYYQCYWPSVSLHVERKFRRQKGHLVVDVEFQLALTVGGPAALKEASAPDLTFPAWRHFDIFNRREATRRKPAPSDPTNWFTVDPPELFGCTK